MDGIKIATIGGGSSYTPELMEGIIKRKGELPVAELWLSDIEEGKEKLEIISNLARRMVEKAGLDIKVFSTLDRRRALEGADFVITQIRVGQQAARIKDERIPLSHGFLGQETNGSGGMLNALRTIPVMLDISKDISELCPGAWMINFTNPSGIVEEALLKYGFTEKAVGLCNVPINVEMGIARSLGVGPERIRVLFAGLNHMVFGLKVYLDGEDITRAAVDKLAEGRLNIHVKNIQGAGFSEDFIKGLGVLPCPYHLYYYQHRDMLGGELKEYEHGITRSEVVAKLESSLFELYKDENLAVKPPQLEQRGGALYSEAACRLISSIYGDKRDIQPVNTRNNGAIWGIPNDSAVEISCVITRDGPRPLAVGELPMAVNGLVQQIKSFERMTVEAAVTGSYRAALVAMTINPLVQSERNAKIILDEMLEAHREHLPQFKPYFEGRRS